MYTSGEICRMLLDRDRNIYKTIVEIEEEQHEDLFETAMLLIGSQDRRARDAGALVISELGDQRAIGQLVELIESSDTKGYRGTLVWALIHLDCRDHFLLLIRTALNDVFEPAIKAMYALRDQHFRVSEQDIAVARQMIREVVPREDMGDDAESQLGEIKGIIQREDDRRRDRAAWIAGFEDQ